MDNDIIIILKALADKNRYRIITLLLEQNLCVKSIARYLNISDSGVSQHLQILKKANLITSIKNEHLILYEVNHDILRQLAYVFTKLASIKKLDNKYNT